MENGVEDSSSEEDFLSKPVTSFVLHVAAPALQGDPSSSEEDFLPHRCAEVSDAIVPAAAPRHSVPSSESAPSSSQYVAVTRKSKKRKIALQTMPLPTKADRILKRPAAQTRERSVDQVIAELLFKGTYNGRRGRLRTLSSVGDDLGLSFNDVYRKVCALAYCVYVMVKLRIVQFLDWLLNTCRVKRDALGNAVESVGPFFLYGEGSTMAHG